MSAHIFASGDELTWDRQRCVVLEQWWYGIRGLGVQALKLLVLGTEDEIVVYAHDCAPVFEPRVVARCAAAHIVHTTGSMRRFG